MTNFTAFSNALQLNNKGVSLLLASKDEEAIKCLGASITMLQQIVHTFNNDTSNNIDPSAPTIAMDTEVTSISSSKSSSNDDIFSPQVQQSGVIHIKTVSLPNLQKDALFIYHKAFQFDTIETLLSQTNQNEIRLYIATVIQNIALAYHRQFVLGKIQCSFRVRTMYEMVSKLLFGRAFDARFQGGDFLVLAAATNNLSVIRHEEVEYDLSLDGFQRLGYLLSTPQLYKEGICNEDIIGMSLNVFAVKRPNVAGAA